MKFQCQSMHIKSFYLKWPCNRFELWTSKYKEKEKERQNNCRLNFIPHSIYHSISMHHSIYLDERNKPSSVNKDKKHYVQLNCWSLMWTNVQRVRVEGNMQHTEGHRERARDEWAMKKMLIYEFFLQSCDSIWLLRYVYWFNSKANSQATRDKYCGGQCAPGRPCYICGWAVVYQSFS